MKLSELIKKRKEELGLTWTDFDNAGIHCNTLSNLLNDKQGGIKPATQEKLALVLKVDKGVLQACIAEMNPLKKVVVNKKSLAKQKPKKAEPEPEPEELPFDDLPEPEPDAVANAVMAETEAYHEPAPEKVKIKPSFTLVEVPVPGKKQEAMAKVFKAENMLDEAAEALGLPLSKKSVEAFKELATTEAPPRDNVNHPAHYTQGGIECIEAIKASMTASEYRGYLKGNAMKYMWRYQHKGGVEDLKKARWYLDRLISEVDR